MENTQEPKIVIKENGPYSVSGNIPITIQVIVQDKDGNSTEWKEVKTINAKPTYSLCRCGHSSNKPFCDGTHLDIDFNGKEVASRSPYKEQAKIYDGPTLKLSDAKNLCAHAGFCDKAGSIWNSIKSSNKPESSKLVLEEVACCPSGRLVVHDKKTGKQIEPEFSPSIALTEDPTWNYSGPLFVRGGIRIESQNGTVYETRNRVTLCRCGGSKNKPFCDGSHFDIKFKDGLLDK